ncbi:MAG: hypothetical protein WCO13_12825 [Bacteroidota bacterium]
MDSLNLFLEILKYILPSLVVFATAFYLIKQFLENDNRKRMLELKMNAQSNNQHLITPIRLQAYERIILFMERISPSSLIIRVTVPTMNAMQMQSAMIKAIRDEYEHNLSQQLYISRQSWNLVKSAKEELVILINDAAANVNGNDNCTELAKVIFEKAANVEKLPIEIALDYVKAEIQEQF